jgi:SET domain
MKYRLPLALYAPQLAKIISRELKKDEISPLPAKDVKALAKICKIIEKKGLPENFICKKLPHNLGHGIFLRPDAKPIEKGEVIAAYAGEVSLIAEQDFKDGSYAFTPVEKILLTREEAEIFDKKHRYHPRRYYLLMIDAVKKGNFARFINHSEKPNVISYLHSIPRNRHGLPPAPLEVIYFAKKKILPGEQLLISYEADEKSYWIAKQGKPYPMSPKTFVIE